MFSKFSTFHDLIQKTVWAFSRFRHVELRLNAGGRPARVTTPKNPLAPEQALPGDKPAQPCTQIGSLVASATKNISQPAALRQHHGP
jgi:hypothetical protein